MFNDGFFFIWVKVKSCLIVFIYKIVVVIILLLVIYGINCLINMIEGSWMYIVFFEIKMLNF